MVVPQPNNAHGLWAAVRAEIEVARGSREPAMAWPDTDEDRVHALAIAWRDASLAFTPVTVSRTIFATTAGEMFAQRVGGIDEWTLQAGANAADWKDGHSADPGDQAAVQLGIDLAHEYGPGALTPEKVTQAILDRYDRFQQAGVIRPM